MLKAAIVALTLCAATAPAAAETSRNALPAFDLKDLKGQNISIADYKSKVLVISFWATWCVPCLQELQFLNDLAERQNQLRVLAIATDGPETQAQVRSIAKRRQWTISVAHDAAGQVGALLNPRGTSPYTLFVDKQGRVVRTQEGFNSGDEAKHEALITQLINEPDGV